MLTTPILPLFDGIFPSTIVTASADGTPNLANLSRIWAVDAARVAVADQLLRKTARNLDENPVALLRLVHPQDFTHWEVEARRLRVETEGSLFERIRQDLLAVSWMAGEENPPPLRSVFVFQVLSVRPCLEEMPAAAPLSERFGALLEELADRLGWSRASCWIPETEDGGLKPVASRGMPPGKGAEEAMEPMRRLAVLARTERRVIRLRNIRSQLRYVHSIRKESGLPGGLKSEYLGEQPEHELAASFLGVPVFSGEGLVGIVCCEATTAEADLFDRSEDGFLRLLGARIGDAVGAAEPLPEADRRLLFRQAIERAAMEWAKRTDPFHTVLSARERQVAVFAAKGLTNEEIAKSLFISKRTVTTHLERIYQKLEVGSRSALTRYVVEKGLDGDPAHDLAP
ncbi:GAF domain-containing protein [Cohnella sp. CFH 77786]|uniref:helix-turn-helix transcriptional regulator n=1 Tax=Cohnella sp. CFH 77786 TaxID=2662265 RepID=UPI001C60E355|nr:LuxR C-terminal-related transcriptional regulator [Cohnella sp. CFH 77786]MBW5446055.1 GAF domain-containing protein [Cohnella sp. CFH 77786]